MRTVKQLAKLEALRDKNTREQLQDILNDLTNSIVTSERKFIMYTGCITYGSRKIPDQPACTNPECVSCQSWNNAVIKAAKNWSNDKQ
tara:strand:+ start:13782 stop:14045 length:264 start_codon:yes stop_codon:yes gene_type:complete